MEPSELDFGTEAHKLRRNDHPDTSHKSAEAVQSALYEQLAYQIHLDAGVAGCTLDHLHHQFAKLAPPRTQYTNRRTGIHQKGYIVDTGYRAIGESGKSQAIYVATKLLNKESIEYIRNNPNAHNPFLHGGSTVREWVSVEKGSAPRVRTYLLFSGGLLHCSAKTVKELEAEANSRFEDGSDWFIVRHSTMQTIKTGKGSKNDQETN